MGSSYSRIDLLNNENCLICWEEIERQRDMYIQCYCCNVRLHKKCERQFRGNKQY